MNRFLRLLFVAIHNNEVVCFETNLKMFAKEFANIETEARNYDWFHRQFKKDNKFQLTLSGKEYHFQKLV